jgi:SAM-dependent methyltransferase
MQSEDFAYLSELEENFWWFVGMRAITASLLDPVCAVAQDRLILDAGCGTGGNLAWLSRYGGKIIGLDLESAAIEYCRERRHERLVQASVTELPFADELFDLVTSFDVLVQIPGAGADERAMREMFRVLRPGGVAFVRAAAYEWMRSGHDTALGSQRRYSLRVLNERMESAGFSVRRATYANALLLPVAMARRLILKRLGLADRGSDVKPLPPQMAWLNRLLTALLAREAHLLAAPQTKLRCGLSVICLAEKPRA